MKILIVLLSLLKASKCALEPFIVEGNYTTIEKHPHSAFLAVNCVTRYRRDFWVCGASIINQRLLLTAAHCLEECMPSSHITISVGSADKTKGFLTTAYSFLYHEKYVPNGVQFDIGLIKTRATIMFSDKVSRVVLMKNPPYKDAAQIAGWGVIDEYREITTPFLKSTDQRVWSRMDCIRILGALPSGTICASSKSLLNYAATGDSGSALVVRDYIQIGLVSYKAPNKSRSLIVYTDTGYYYNWIEKNSKRLYCGL